jgi:hypothetical protein
LVYSDPSTPLFDEQSDPAIVMQMIEDAGELELSSIDLLQGTIFKCICFFGAEMIIVGGGDAYAGIQRTSYAIAEICSEYNLEPLEMLNTDRAEVNTPFRSAIFRRCMLPEQWDTLSEILTETFKDDPGTSEKIMMPETARETQQLLRQASRFYFKERKHQIWPELAG